MEEFRAAMGDDFTPSPLLARVARESAGFVNSQPDRPMRGYAGAINRKKINAPPTRLRRATAAGACASQPAAPISPVDS